jgi:hypothetical protein
MNENELDRRIKRAEEKVGTSGNKEVRFCWVEDGQTEAEAERLWREENPGADVTLYFVGWDDRETWPPPPPRPEGATLDEQIDKILKELQSEGFSLEQITEMLKDESPVIPETEEPPQPEETTPSREEPGQEEPEPKKAEELTRLFSGRRRR